MQPADDEERSVVSAASTSAAVAPRPGAQGEARRAQVLRLDREQVPDGPCRRARAPVEQLRRRRVAGAVCGGHSATRTR